MKPKLQLRIIISILFLSVSVLGLSACEALENQLKSDRSGGLEKQDYRDALAPRDLEFSDDVNAMTEFGKRPSLRPYISQKAASYEAFPLVSVSINRSVPLRDIFYHLADQADFDLELDPRIRGSIIFTARKRPLDQVVERICNMTGLRHNLDDKILRVELDTPYNKTYKIDYLSYIRSNSSSITTDISVVSGAEANTGSSFQNSAESSTDFWGELDENLGLILANATKNELKTNNDPQVNVLEQNVTVKPVAVPDENGNVVVSPPDAILTVVEQPLENNIVEEEGVAAQYVMNKQAGLVNVYANQVTHQEIEEYLFKLKRAVTAQVLVEAKILEVSLNDDYASGIDWRALDVLSGEVVLNYLTTAGTGLLTQAAGGSGATIDNAPPSVSGNDSAFAVGYVGNDIQALVRALSQYGTIKALASPRLTVLNNQAAVLNVATNKVFFEIDIDVTTDDGTTQTEIESEIRNVPEGVLVNVQPSINLDDGTVSMAIRPTVTRVIREVADPGVQFVTASNNITGIENLIPEINVQEIDSVVQMRSGQPIVMGGLLQDISSADEDGVPILSDAPLIGSFFRSHSDAIQKSELVIFLKATILDDPSQSIHDTDRDLYRKFSEDRRPFKL